jgi:16S rRNA (cytosine967-C5)-methyltransferase
VRIQEEGSQLIGELCGDVQQVPKTILDCCAAPGGKTLILAERNSQANVTALEISPTRCEALRSRIAESRFAAQIEVIQGDAAALPSEPKFDLILADVPCSGTGTLGRNPEIRHRLQPADLKRHHQRQCAILRGALRAGSGRVIYSTCSLEPEENAEVVAEVLAEHPDWRQIPVANVLRELRDEGILMTAYNEDFLVACAPDGSLTILPGSLGPDVQTDGFFVAILEKLPAISLL